VEHRRRLACRRDLVLFSEPQLHVNRLIDIANLGWPALEVSEQGLRIAATCKIAELDGMTFPSSWAAAPLVGQCCRSFLSSFKIWNWRPSAAISACRCRRGR
jgi:hypothetical protein